MVEFTPIEELSSDKKSTFKSATQALGQDEFLKLLIAQLKNQDPLDPLDNSQFIAQLAQFSQLEETKKTNKSLDKLLERQDVANNNSLVSLLDRTVSAAGSSVSLTSGVPTTLSYRLAGAASSVTVQVLDSSGRLVRTLKLADQAAGLRSAAWDGKDDAGRALPSGRYSFTVEATTGKGAAVTATTLVSGVVTGLTFKDGNPSLTLASGQTLAPEDILEVR